MMYRTKIDHLNVEVYETRRKLGQSAARQVIEKMKEIQTTKGMVRLIFAAAPSQNEFLEELASTSEIDWSLVTVFHMDEYVGLPEGDARRFGKFLSDRLFNLVKPKEAHLIDASTPEAECQRYGSLLNQEPIDIVCLGIGENGHIAFNDPPVADFTDPYTMKMVELDEKCRWQQVHDGCFASFTDVPTHALTLTIPALFAGTYLFCMVPGKNKKEAVHKTLYGEITTECPASILRNHPDCTLYLDAESWGKDL
jgi:glucosamine-6-phosphate deaminase